MTGAQPIGGLFPLQWFAIGCGMEASTELRSARDYEEAFERIADTRNMLVVMLNGTDEDEHMDARIALEPAIEYCDAQLTRVRQAHRLRAFDNEMLKDPDDERRFGLILMRKLLEHGIEPMLYAALKNPRLAGDKAALKESGDRVRAQNERSVVRRFYERSRDVLQELFEDAQSGRVVFLPAGEVFRDRRGQMYRSRWATPMDAAREIERLTRLIVTLSPRTDS